MPVRSITIEDIKTSLVEDISHVEALIEKSHPADSASLIRELDLDNKVTLMLSLKPLMAGSILSELESLSAAEEFLLTEKLPVEFLVEIINAMPSDNAVDLLNTFKTKVVSDLLSKLPPEKSESLEEMLRFGEDSAGGLMTNDFFSLPDYTCVRDAIAEIKQRNAKDIVNYNFIYITDSQERLIGLISMVDLLVHPDDTALKDVMDIDPIVVNADVDQEQVAKMFTKYDLVALPVVNRGKRIIGRITVDDVLNVINEETDEDIYKMVGTDDVEKETPSSIKIASIRLPWLLTTLMGSFICSTIIKNFSDDVSNYLSIFFFMPVITAISGNIGVQCSTLIVRGLATGFVQLTSVFSIFIKEIKIGSIMAITCSLVAGIFAFAFITHDFKMGIAVALSMFCCMIFAAVSGTAVPLVLKKYGFDPAIASGPIITTFNDITGLLIYFSISLAILI